MSDPVRPIALSPVAPWPIRDGFTLRIASFLEALARTGPLLLVAPDGTAAEDGVPDGVEVRTYPQPGLNGRGAVLTFLGKDIWPFPFDPDPLTERLEEVAAANPGSPVLCWGGTVLSAVRVFGTRICVDVVDCQSLHFLRAARSGRGWTRRFGLLRDAAVHRAYEWKLLSRPAQLLAAGTGDRRALEGVRDDGPVDVLPNGVDIRHFAPRPGDREPDPTAVFTGTLNYEPNVDAVRLLVERIWPRVLEEEPHARLLVAGRNPEPGIRKLDGRSGVRILGSVEEMPSVLARAWLAVAPMISGTGIKNKVLEAWAMELPVVMTSLAANGIEDSAREASIVADDPEGLARGITTLFRDETLRRHIGRMGRETVMERHTWEAAGDRLRNILDGVGPATGPRGTGAGDDVRRSPG